MKLLLHCCCAPCSVSCAGNLRSDNIEPHLFWYNPNIHPFCEYLSRLNCLTKFAEDENFQFINIDKYSIELFLSAVYKKKESRCRLCCRMRLERAASFAAQEGYTAFSTTLLISPYQDHEAIMKTGEETAEKYSVDFFYRDFRPLFREGQNAARSGGMYMQKYCGCIFSEEERYLKTPPLEKI